jgi:NDP-sugar pyrophosphorylase family protein
VIEGPAIIGPDCELGAGCLIRPGTILGRGVVIGHGAEVKHSLVFAGAKLQSLTFVGDSVVGKGGRVGSGVITANRRFDQGRIAVRADGERLDLPWAFFGCILGDYARLGANAVTLPGTLIGPYSWVMPLTTVGGVIPRASLVREERRLSIRPKPEQRLDPGRGGGRDG